MESPSFNYLAIVAASLSSFVVGFLWYGPLFGKAWMSASGTTQEDLKKFNPIKVYGLSFVMSLIAAYVLAHVLWAFGHAMPDTTGVWAGIQGGFWSWLGFILTTKVVDNLYEHRGQKLLWINAGYRLVWLVVMGIIIAVWK